MASFDRWCRWLAVVAAGLTAFGLFMAVASGTGLFEPLHRLIDPAFWQSPPDAAAVAFRAWAYGVWGATLAGWGITIGLLVHDAFARRERWSRQALAVATGAWFVLDTGVSVGHGVTANVVINVVILAAV
ncbi:MAG TPA: hypothetical protein VF763_14920, partial [Candidatus Limnocylindrales bacterium]